MHQTKCTVDIFTRHGSSGYGNLTMNTGYANCVWLPKLTVLSIVTWLKFRSLQYLHVLTNTSGFEFQGLGSCPQTIRLAYVLYKPPANTKRPKHLSTEFLLDSKKGGFTNLPVILGGTDALKLLKMGNRPHPQALKWLPEQIFQGNQNFSSRPGCKHQSWWWQ